MKAILARSDNIDLGEYEKTLFCFHDEGEIDLNSFNVDDKLTAVVNILKRDPEIFNENVQQQGPGQGQGQEEEEELERPPSMESESSELTVESVLFKASELSKDIGLPEDALQELHLAKDELEYRKVLNTLLKAVLSSGAKGYPGNLIIEYVLNIYII